MQKPLMCPYIPSDTVLKVLVAGNAPLKILETLLLHGIDPITTSPLKNLPLSLSRHADMQLVNVCEGVFVFAPGTSNYILNSLNTLGFKLIRGDTTLKGSYPYDVAYNCAIVGKHAFLNPRYTDTKLLDLLRQSDIKVAPVKQGYAKCSTCILNQEAIITADISIHEKAIEMGLDSLLIPPQLSIRLNGYNYGFIGGSSGLISKSELAFLGDFQTLESAEIMDEFMAKYGITPVSLSHENIVDMGGIIPLCSV